MIFLIYFLRVYVHNDFFLRFLDFLNLFIVIIRILRILIAIFTDDLVLSVLGSVHVFNKNLCVLSFVVSVENVSSDLGFAMVILLVAEIYGDFGQLLLLLNSLQLFLKKTDIEMWVGLALIFWSLYF